MEAALFGGSLFSYTGGMKTLAIIGGGAAGLAAAVAAGEAARDAAAPVRVVVYEADERVGRSILATGNGRCNFSNTRISPKLYRNAPFVEEALRHFEGAAFMRVPSQAREATASVHGVLAFFSDHGLAWREESEGRLYPLANKASSVLDCLRAAAAAAGVQVRGECEVVTVEPPRCPGAPFTMRLADGRFERADAVIVAVGGSIARRLMPEGVPWVVPTPTLGPVACDSPWPRRLDNIRVRGALELWRPGGAPADARYRDMLDRLGHGPEDHGHERLVSREVGEVMFRKYGVSGIAAFNLSRLMQPGDELALDFLPTVPAREAEAYLLRRRNLLRQALGTPISADDLLRGMVLAPVAEVLLRAAELEGAEAATDEAVTRLAVPLKGLRLPVAGLGDARQCQVHRGGVACEAVSPRTGELRGVAGLYVVGEALDVDAPCGGYNLHWAWASGLSAGWAAVSALAHDAAEEAEGAAR